MFKIINKLLILLMLLTLNSSILPADDENSGTSSSTEEDSGSSSSDEDSETSGSTEEDSGSSSSDEDSETSGSTQEDSGSSSSDEDSDNCPQYQSLREKYENDNTEKYLYYTDLYIKQCTSLTIKIEGDSSVIEGDSNTTDLKFLVTLSQNAIEDVIFTYSITDGTATLGEDYTIENNLTMIIPKDSNSTTITIKVKGDSKVENDETILVRIENATNAILNLSNNDNDSSSGSSGDSSSGSSGDSSSGSSGDSSSGSSGDSSSGTNNLSATGTILNDDNAKTPIAEYHFDTCQWYGVIGEVKDSSGMNNHLNAINGTQTINSGKILRALEINEANQKIQGDTNISLSNELTLNAWIKTSTNQAVGGSYTRIVELSKTGNYTYSTDLAYLPDGKTIRGWTTNNDNLRTTEVQFNLEDNGFHDGQWHLLSYTYNNGETKLYVDGLLKQTQTKDIGDLVNPKKISIGGYYNSSSNRFTGQIDEVTIFDKALSIDEINILKNKTALNRVALDCANLHSISGFTFQDENRNNIFDASIDVSLKNIQIELFKDTNTFVGTMQSDINGKFAFVNLPVGNYLLIVDSNDSDITTGYTLNNNETLNLNLQNDLSNNYFAFVPETALPVGCLENALMFQNAPTDISYLDLANGNMVVEAENVTPGNINAAGFNKKDGYYWGFNYTLKNGTLSRVGKNSEGNLAVDHFSIANLSINSYTGDIDDNGHLYLKETGNSQNVSVIDLDPESDTYLTKLRDFTLEGTLGIADWAFNSQDDKLYAVGGNKLYKIEPSTGAFLSIQDINLTGSTGYGASFFDKDGNYYIYRNSTGEIFRIDVDTQNPQAIPFATGGIVSTNDGAMCTDIEIRFDFGDAPSNYATTLENNGARHRIKTSEGETHYLGTDVTTENDGKPSVEADQDEYDDGVTVGEVSLQNYMITSKESLSNLNIKTYGNGYLNAWIDWDRDGDFNASEQIAQNINGASGIIELNLNDIPNINFNGKPIYARFRYSSQENLNATGTAPDGEVEDYVMQTADYPTLIINDVKQIEGNSGTSNFIFNLSFSKAPEQEGSFTYETQDGTATIANSDYEATSDTIYFSEEENEFQVEIIVNGDVDIEPDEVFYLNFDEPNYINIIDTPAVGTILNDDIPEIHIERINSGIILDLDSQERKAFYTQVTGKDFDYSIVSYSGNTLYPISNTTVKLELIDYNSSNNDIIYGSVYHYIENSTSRIDISLSDDLKTIISTRNAAFKISYLLDENGTMLTGKYNEEIAYANIEDLNGNQAISNYSDNFAIRPVSYNISIGENDGTIYAINNSNTQLDLVAGHNYKVKVSATKYNSNTIATNYRQESNQQIDTNLTFMSNTNCNDDSNRSLDYRFTDGQINTTFTHNNYGKYKFSIIDSNWTKIDQINGDCILNDATLNNDNGKVGCNISSNFDANHQDMNVEFRPYTFDMNNTTLSNIHNNENYLYMSDLTLSTKMGVMLRSTIVAKGEQGTQLSNFTKSCIDNEATLTVGLKFSFLSDEGESNNTDFTPPKSILERNGDRTILMPQQIVKMNENNNTNVDYMRDVNIEEEFLDENNGSLQISTLYNMQKLFTKPTNPIKVDFISYELNTNNLKGYIEGIKESPRGMKNINLTKTFYFARITSHVEYYPRTDKTSIITPLYVEIFCKIPGNRAWCDNGMNLRSIGRNLQSKTDRGWYLAIKHNSLTDGRVNRLISSNPNVVNVIPNTSLPPFVNGRINDVLTVAVNNNLTQKIEAEIAIETDVWLQYRYYQKESLQVPDVDYNTSSYSVIMRNISSMAGISATGHLQETTKRVEHNGKMSW